MVRIPNYVFTNKISLKMNFFGGVTPLLAPQKGKGPKNDHPWLTLTLILIAESYTTIKMGVFAKN